MRKAFKPYALCISGCFLIGCNVNAPQSNELDERDQNTGQYEKIVKFYFGNLLPTKYTLRRDCSWKQEQIKLHDKYTLEFLRQDCPKEKLEFEMHGDQLDVTVLYDYGLPLGTKPLLPTAEFLRLETSNADPEAYFKMFSNDENALKQCVAMQDAYGVWTVSNSGYKKIPDFEIDEQRQKELKELAKKGFHKQYAEQYGLLSKAHKQKYADQINKNNACADFPTVHQIVFKNGFILSVREQLAIPYLKLNSIEVKF